VAPTVTSTNPASGATGVATSTTVRFAFSEDLNAASVTAASAELRTGGGTLVAATVTYDAATRSVVLTPTAGLAASTGYTATMKANGARDPSGNALAADRATSFTTAASAPPPPPGGVIGYNTAGASADSYNSNWMNGSKVTTGSSSQTISTMTVFVRGTVSAAPNNRFRLAVYTDSGGSPGTLVASTAEGTLVANSWNSAPITATLAAGTAYWFIYNTNGTSPNDNNMAFDVGAAAGGGWSTGAVTYGTWPASFGGFTQSSGRYSIYAQ
jgi:hypothetical protein